MVGCDEGGETEVGTHSLSSCVRSWAAVFVRGWLFSPVGVHSCLWAIVFICEHSSLGVGGHLHMWPCSDMGGCLHTWTVVWAVVSTRELLSSYVGSQGSYSG